MQAGVIRVERSWDKLAGVIAPKSRAGRRKVPIVAALRTHLAAHKLRRGTLGGLFFGTGGRPLNRAMLIKRCLRAWRAAGLTPIGLHEARHTCASIFIAAGVNVNTRRSPRQWSLTAGTGPVGYRLVLGNPAPSGDDVVDQGVADAYMQEMWGVAGAPRV